MAIINYNEPLLMDGEPAFNVGHGVYPDGIVYYVSSGLPPLIYPYNELGAPINDPFFTAQGYPVGTALLENGKNPCPCVVPNPEELVNDPLVKDLYLVQWDDAFTLSSLEDIRFGYDVVHTMPQSIVHLRLSLSGDTGTVNNVVTELLDVAETIVNFYSLGEKPITPESHFYDDSLIYG